MICLVTHRENKTAAESIEDFQGTAQFYLDFVEAENSSSFHAPEEALRILGEPINFSREGQLELRPSATETGASSASP